MVNMQEFEVSGLKVRLAPVGGKYLNTYIKLLNKVSGLNNKGLTDDEFTKHFLSLLEDMDLEKVFDLIKESVRLGGNSFSGEDLDLFVSANFLALLPLVVGLNLPKR